MGVKLNNETLNEYICRMGYKSTNILKDRVDFHIHTSKSDGEEDLMTVVNSAANQRMKAIAITEHNCFNITHTWLYKNMYIIPGCEFSCNYKKSDTKEDVEVHVIGLFPNGVEPYAFQDICTIKNKEEYINAVLKFLKNKGMNISLDEVKQQMKNNSSHLGRKHIAEVMVKKGYVQNKTEALDKYIGNYSPYFINPIPFLNYCNMEEVVRRISLNGGIPVLAYL